jgi:hypothetical protein
MLSKQCTADGPKGHPLCPFPFTCGCVCHTGEPGDNQPSLFAPDYHTGRVRRDDYPTSIEGAKSVAYRAGSQKALLLAAHRAHPHGLNDYEAALAAGVSLVSCYWKRCGELRADGKIIETEETSPGQWGDPRLVSRYSHD